MNVILSDLDKDIKITGVYKTHPTARSFYARSGNKYVHRIVLSRVLGVNLSRTDRVDHINGNGLDCRRDNLRLATCSQNSANRLGWRKSSSKYKGVTFSKQRKDWQAKITVNGKTIHLGYFKNEEDAGKAYDKQALIEFGEYAKLNFMEL
jgi:HNH endonuclease/AP2 domain